jgi:lipid II isoglutaminyl synthase (glutamine-hydrolysing)
MNSIKIIHLYPKEMNIYGDNGNILVLRRRLDWRNIPNEVIRIGIGDKLPDDAHIIVGGGGQDAGQSLIASDLKHKTKSLQYLVESGTPMLMICGMYQMFGHYFKTQDGTVIPGIGILDVITEAAKGRLIGNVICETTWGKIVGYENHSGRTKLGAMAKPLGSTKKGQGNNGMDNTEGARQNSVFGSYLHGPILARSPEFTDYLLELAIDKAGLKKSLMKLDDKLENLARQIAASRPR